MAKPIRKFFRYLLRLFLGIIIFVLLYGLFALILSAIPVNTKSDVAGDVTIYIKSNGVHTDIVVPIRNDVKDWSTDILYTHTRAKDSIMRYIAFGWGDKGFYLDTPQWSDLKASTAFTAAFYLGTSAMHTHFYKRLEENERCVRVTIRREEYKALVQYIADSFKTDEEHKIMWIANRSYGDYDAFYEAKGRYSLFYTCNTWANNALKAANCPAALWTPADKGIFMHYD